MKTIQFPYADVVHAALAADVPHANVLPFPVVSMPHPEIGWVLEEQEGAQSSGSAYDQGQEPDGLIKLVLRIQAQFGMPIIDATLASDGWWWRICHPWKYGLVD